MSFEQTRDIVDHAILFHKNLSDYYDRLEEIVTDKKVKFLLEYMQRHERYMVSALEKYCDSGDGRVTRTFFKYTSTKATEECIIKLAAGPELTLDGLVDIALKMDQCLVEFFREVAEKAPIPEVRDALNRMMELEKREGIQIQRSAQYVREG